MLGAKKVSARFDLIKSGCGQRVFVTDNGLHQACKHLQHLNVDNKFLQRSGQAAFQPAGAVQENIASAHDGTPAGHLRFISRLGIGCVGRVNV